MLGICKPVIVKSAFSFTRRLFQVRSRALRPALPQVRVTMTEGLSSKALLDAQSFGGDLLNRSVGDRRDESFVDSAFKHSTSLLITGRSVLAKHKTGVNGSRPQGTELCWLSPSDFQEYGLEAQTDSQTTIAGAAALEHPKCCNTCATDQQIYVDQADGRLVPYLLGQTQQQQWAFALDASAYSNQEQLKAHAERKGSFSIDPSNTRCITAILEQVHR